MWLKLRDFLYTRSAKVVFVVLAVALVGGVGSLLVGRVARDPQPVVVGPGPAGEASAEGAGRFEDSPVSRPSTCQESLGLAESMMAQEQKTGVLTYADQAQLWLAYEQARDLCSFALVEEYTNIRIIPWLMERRARTNGDGAVLDGGTQTTTTTTTTTTLPGGIPSPIPEDMNGGGA